MGSFVMWMFVFPARPYDRDTIVQYTRLIVLLGFLRGIWLWKVTRPDGSLALMHRYVEFALNLLVNVGFLAVSRGQMDHEVVDIRSLSEGRSTLAMLVSLGAIYVHYIMQSAQTLTDASEPS